MKKRAFLTLFWMTFGALATGVGNGSVGGTLSLKEIPLDLNLACSASLSVSLVDYSEDGAPAVHHALYESNFSLTAKRGERIATNEDPYISKKFSSKDWTLNQAKSHFSKPLDSFVEGPSLSVTFEDKGIRLLDLNHFVKEPERVRASIQFGPQGKGATFDQVGASRKVDPESEGFDLNIDHSKFSPDSRLFKSFSIDCKILDRAQSSKSMAPTN